MHEAKEMHDSGSKSELIFFIDYHYKARCIQKKQNADETFRELLERVIAIYIFKVQLHQHGKMKYA